MNESAANNTLNFFSFKSMLEKKRRTRKQEYGEEKGRTEQKKSITMSSDGVEVKMFK